MNWKKVAVICGAVAIVGVGAYLAFHSNKPPKPEELTKENVLQTMASADFSKLTAEEKLQYAARIRELGGRPHGQNDSLSDEEKQRMRANGREIFQEVMRQRVVAYFELPPEQREAYLDQQIAQMPNWGKRGGGERPPGANPPENRENRRGTDDPKTSTDRRTQRLTHMKEMIETSDPAERAQFTQYMKDLRARRQATRNK